MGDDDASNAGDDPSSNPGGGGNAGSRKRQTKKNAASVTPGVVPAPQPVDPINMDPKDAQAMFQSLASEADRLAAGGWFAEALERYNRALEFHPEDPSCLVNRSRCHMMLGDTQSALEDATKSLEKDPAFIRGIYQKAESLYAGGHFEDALVLYHRGRRARPELAGFVVGIHKATESIRNAVALLDPVKLRQKREKVKRSWGEGNGENRNVSPVPSLRVAGVPEAPRGKGRSNVPTNSTKSQVSPSPPPASYHQIRADDQEQSSQQNTFLFRTRSEPVVLLSKTEKENQERNLLEELYDDKAFLEELSRDDRFMTAGSGGGGKETGEVGKLVEEGIRFLKGRVEFWRQRNPAGVPAAAIAAADHNAATRQKILRHRGVALSNAVGKRTPMHQQNAEEEISSALCDDMPTKFEESVGEPIKIYG
ncbi:Tetratricopeptide repeat protein 25 [Dinochytrium kinnereticum]|nr:Tetratricopeptide repeat protein 25 [Dinochytrium kinnereticum]